MFQFVASQTREITRNSEIIRPYSSSRSSKVIDLGVNRKPICDFLLVINSNFSRIWYTPKPYFFWFTAGLRKFSAADVSGEQKMQLEINNLLCIIVLVFSLMFIKRFIFRIICFNFYTFCLIHFIAF